MTDNNFKNPIYVSYRSSEYTLIRAENDYYLRRGGYFGEDERDENGIIATPSPDTIGKKDLLIPFREITRIAIDPKIVEYKRYLTYGTIKITVNDSKTHTLVLSEQISDQALTDFFAPVAHRIATDAKKDEVRREQAKKDGDYKRWLTENRDPTVFRRLKLLSRATHVVFFASLFLQLLWPIFTMWLCTALFVINYAPVLLFPAYFSVSAETKKFKALYGMDCIPILTFLPYPAVINLLILFRQAPNMTGFLLPSLVLTAVLILPIALRYGHELRTDATRVIALILIMGIAVSATFSALNGQYAMNHPISEESLVVIEKNVHNGRRSTSYDVTVTRPDGTVKTYDVSHSVYEDVRTGEPITLYVYEGLFGVTYTKISAP
ncbi:MAG: hypothetical protein IJV98_08380 [Clostridia bacterium]|nr:hypothetical protein [Clostridia bacterium]